jgi:imidazolonepropionase
VSAPRLLFARRLVTCDAARSTPADPLGTIDDGALVIEAGRITWVGPRAAAPHVAEVMDGGPLVTPGLVDAHTHAAWTGSRHEEYELRMAGADYRAIAAAGGGIASSQRATAETTEDAIAVTLAARLRRMASLGVTCVEVKSGYGLEAEEELKQLRAIARARAQGDVPAVVPTFLALHALPRSAASDREAYVQRVTRELVPEVAAAGLARFVDAYVDAGAFTAEEGRAAGQAALSAGLAVRMHVGQFADVGGAEVCAELGARSADHLEHVSDAGIEALARAGVSAGLLPTACFTLAQQPPPVARLRAAGVPMVIASDANPGTAPTESLPLAMAMAVRLYAMTPAEVILGATRLAADSLDEPLRGRIAVGAHADVVAWDLPHELALLQPWGVSRADLVLRGGVPIGGARHAARVGS